LTSARKRLTGDFAADFVVFIVFDVVAVDFLVAIGMPPVVWPRAST
jgi:hypothetical protein